MFIKPDGRPYFYDLKGKPKIPFHWTQSSIHYSSWPRSTMTLQDKEVFHILDQLSNRLPTQKFMTLYESSQRWADLAGMFHFNILIFFLHVYHVLNFL